MWCECVSVWVCECVSVWVCECVSVWVCECVSVWVCECVSVWVCECVSVWVSVCANELWMQCDLLCLQSSWCWNSNASDKSCLVLNWMIPLCSWSHKSKRMFDTWTEKTGYLQSRIHSGVEWWTCHRLSSTLRKLEDWLRLHFYWYCAVQPASRPKCHGSSCLWIESATGSPGVFWCQLLSQLIPALLHLRIRNHWQYGTARPSAHSWGVGPALCWAFGAISRKFHAFRGPRIGQLSSIRRFNAEFSWVQTWNTTNPTRKGRARITWQMSQDDLG